MIMKDKKYHVLAGLLTFFVGLPVYQLAYDAATDTHHLAAAICATIVSGILLANCKEFCDMRTDGNKWSWTDFGCTCIGVGIAVLFILGLHFGQG